MDIRNQILDKYKEFNQFLESIDLSSLRQQFNRQELNEFNEQLRGIDIRSVWYDIKKMTDEMKKEEYPQLLGVHHYPVINEINFLSEKQKLELDKYLVMHRVGNYVSGLWSITRENDIEKRLQTWLLNREVLKEVHVALCPHCRDGYISNVVDQDGKDGIEELFHRYKEDDGFEEYEELNRTIESGCMNCDSEIDIDEEKELIWKTMYKMHMERDNSLDKV